MVSLVSAGAFFLIGCDDKDAVAAEAVCGNGSVEGDEECDDEGTAICDGCDADCQVEPGYECDDSEPSICNFVGIFLPRGC